MILQANKANFWRTKPLSYGVAAIGVLLTTAVLYYLHAGDNLANIFMIYILVVILSAIQLGRVAAVLAALLSFVFIDYCFVDPKYELTIAQPSEWFALSVFLLVAIITGQLTARLRAEIENTLKHDAEMTALAEISWQVASVPDNAVALKKTLQSMSELLNLKAIAVILVQEENALRLHASFGLPDAEQEALLQGTQLDAVEFVRTKALPLGPYAPNFPNASSGLTAYENSAHLTDLSTTFLPISLDGLIQGIVYLRSKESGMPNARERQMLQALINHVTLILQREKSFAAEARAQALLEANKLKTALLQMVSHDFRSPLTSITASIQTLKSAGPNLSPDIEKTLLDVVDNETERINKMVTNILDLSRLEAGAWRPKCESFPLSELIGSVLSSFKGEDNKRIIVRNEGGVESVYVDGIQIEQVIKNLLENALKYSKSEQTVDLSCRLEKEALLLEVSDRGIGLAQGEEELVFEPFYRGKKLGESNIPGVGIGLSICKGLVEAHGGIIKAMRRESGGTTFCVTLPNRHSAKLPELIKS
jgi:two-component system sensor histidine kinase KdpD